MSLSKKFKLIGFSLYFSFLIISYLFHYLPGQSIGSNFFSFTLTMIKIIPCAFILIGLFEVWIKRETVEKHLGSNSNFVAYLWIFLLASTTVGGLYVAFPVAASLYKKGAKLNIIFTYLGAVSVCRIPMAIFEMNFVGVKFTLIRWSISIPLILISSILLGNYLEKRNYKIYS